MVCRSTEKRVGIPIRDASLNNVLDNAVSRAERRVSCAVVRDFNHCCRWCVVLGDMASTWTTVLLTRVDLITENSEYDRVRDNSEVWGGLHLINRRRRVRSDHIRRRRCENYQLYPL